MDEELLCLCVISTDAEPPEIQNCPANMLVYADRGVTSGTATWQPPTAVDHRDDNVTATLTQGQPPGSKFEAGLPHTITYVARDSDGNVAVPCTFLVTTLGKMGRRA